MNTALKTEYFEDQEKRFTVAGDTPEVLTDIYQDNCNMAVWLRQLPSEFIARLSQDLGDRPLMNTVLEVGAETILDDLVGVAEDREYGAQLRGYMAEVIDMFCVLFDADKVGVRLTVLTQAMCPRFHYDRVPCRLVTTFSGAGTQWIADELIDKTKLGHGSNGKPDEASGLIHRTSDIQALACGDVALLKGDTWEGNEGKALIHRSPPIEAGECRLLMTVDFTQ
jgi:hypothetical protein